MKTKTEIIAKFKNTDYGIESYVTIGHLGFHVSLKDTDANKFVGLVVCYKEKDKAISKAMEIVA